MRVLYPIIAGLCIVPLCAWAGAGFYNDGVPGLVAFERVAPSRQIAPSRVETFPSVRGIKQDRTVRPFNLGMPAVSIEISGHSNSAITVRDRDGSLLYQVDPATRTTIVAKRMGRGQPALASQPATSLRLPDGCESPFSPYAAPNKANVIGRCIS